MPLTREQILNASDLQTEDVEVPEWGGSVRVRSLTGTERDAFEESMVAGHGANSTVKLANMRAKLVAACAVNGDGKRLFQPNDIAALGQKNAAALDRLFAVARRLSGLNEQDIEELVGNSGGGPDAASPSDSP